MGVNTHQLRKISLKLQILTLMTYMLGFIVLKLSGSKKEGIPRYGKINAFEYTCELYLYCI